MRLTYFCVISAPALDDAFGVYVEIGGLCAYVDAAEFGFVEDHAHELVVLGGYVDYTLGVEEV